MARRGRLMPLVRLATAGARPAASRMLRGTAEAAGPLLGELLAPSRCRALPRVAAPAGGSENPSVMMDDQDHGSHRQGFTLASLDAPQLLSSVTRLFLVSG